MSEHRVSWPKSLRDRAKSEGKGLYAVGIDNKDVRASQYGMMDHELTHKLFRFANLLYFGRSPREAFDEVWPETPK